MSRRRYTQRINITINPSHLSLVDEQVLRLHTSRSGLIRLALQEFMEAHPDPAKDDYSDIDLDRPYSEQLRPGASAEESLRFLDRYEAARRLRYNG